MGLIHEAKDRVKWQALVNRAMSLEVPQNVADLLTSVDTISFSRKILF
jgi:hypothetical protein